MKRASSQSASYTHGVTSVTSVEPPNVVSANVALASTKLKDAPPSRAASASTHGRHGSRLLYIKRLQQQAAAHARVSDTGAADFVSASVQVDTDEKDAPSLRQAAAILSIESSATPRKEMPVPPPVADQAASVSAAPVTASPTLNAEVVRIRGRAVHEASRAARSVQAGAAEYRHASATDEADVRRLREAHNFKARPVDPRIYDAPSATHAVRARSKPATIARSPSLATKARSRRSSAVAAASVPAATAVAVGRQDHRGYPTEAPTTTFALAEAPVDSAPFSFDPELIPPSSSSSVMIPEATTTQGLVSVSTATTAPVESHTVALDSMSRGKSSGAYVTTRTAISVSAARGLVARKPNMPTPASFPGSKSSKPQLQQKSEKAGGVGAPVISVSLGASQPVDGM